MKRIVKTDKQKYLIKASNLFSFLPVGLTGGATYLFMDSWWPVALLNVPAAALTVICYYENAVSEIGRLYARFRYDYDFGLYEGKKGYRADLYEKISEEIESVRTKDIAAAILFKKPFDIVIDKKVDEMYGEVDIFTARFDGKGLEVQHINEPSIFDIMTDAIGNARKLK